MAGSDITTDGRDVVEDFVADATSIGALHGSVRGNRNVTQRIAAMDALGNVHGERLLDIGCGTGEYTTALAERFARVDGIEIERKRLEVFEQNKPDNVSLQLMSASQLDFDDDTFDVVVMIEVLEHLADVPGALKEIQRVLKPGGSFYLTTPSRRWPLEQHGVLVKGKRYKSIFMPGLVWIKPLHERFSDAAAFEPKEVAALADAADMSLVGHRFMMPPLDSLPEGHRVHQLTERLADAGANQVFGQTLVARLDPRDDIIRLP